MQQFFVLFPQNLIVFLQTRFLISQQSVFAEKPFVLVLQSFYLMQVSQKFSLPAVVVIFINKFAVFHLIPPEDTVTLDLFVGLQLFLYFQEGVHLLYHQWYIEYTLLQFVHTFKLIGGSSQFRLTTTMTEHSKPIFTKFDLFLVGLLRYQDIFGELVDYPLFFSIDFIDQMRLYIVLKIKFLRQGLKNFLLEITLNHQRTCFPALKHHVVDILQKLRMVKDIGIEVGIYILSIRSHQVFVVIYHLHNYLIQFLAALGIQSNTMTVNYSLENGINASFFSRVSPLAHFVLDVSCEGSEKLQSSAVQPYTFGVFAFSLPSNKAL